MFFALAFLAPKDGRDAAVSGGGPALLFDTALAFLFNSFLLFLAFLIV